jgi:hypothetical protein
MVRPPPVPQELDDGQDNREADAWNDPRTATPAKQTIDSQNSHCWMRKMRRRSAISKRPKAAEITTAARAPVRQALQQIWARRSASSATATAPMIPASWVFAPAASATAVREELLLIGIALEEPGRQVAMPSPSIS